MPSLVWDKHPTLFPLNSSISPSDLSMCTDQTSATPHHTHRAVLASSSTLLQSVLQDCCACLTTSIILPEVSDNILQKLLDWLYIGKVAFEEEWQRLEWIELGCRLGIGRETVWGEVEEGEKSNNNNSDNASEQKQKSIKKATRKKSMKGNLLLKSLNCLNMDDSLLSTYTRKSFCEVDIFTSDDDSFAIVDKEEDYVLEKSIIDDILYDVKDKVSSCIQCDLSYEEHEPQSNSDNDTQNTLDVHRGNNSTTVGNLTTFSGSEFHDVTASLGMKSDNLVAWNENDFSEEAALVVNETVYQDCEEEIDESVESKGVGDADDVSDAIGAIDNTFTDPVSSESEVSLEQDVDGGSNEVGQNVDIGEEEGEDDNIYDDDGDSYDEDDESDDDSSWNASGTDISEHSDDEGITSNKSKEAIPLGDIKNINLSTVNNTSVLGEWLSDTGPVHMVTRCLCKGACVRACACRTAGGSCSRRCSCQPSKCKLRAEAGGQGAQHSGGEDDGKIIDEDGGLVVGVEEPNNSSPSIASTPSCPPIPLLASTSMLSTTAKKRNKKKLFTETVGPQEL